MSIITGVVFFDKHFLYISSLCRVKGPAGEVSGEEATHTHHVVVEVETEPHLGVAASLSCRNTISESLNQINVVSQLSGLVFRSSFLV